MRGDVKGVRSADDSQHRRVESTQFLSLSHNTRGGKGRSNFTRLKWGLCASVERIPSSISRQIGCHENGRKCAAYRTLTLLSSFKADSPNANEIKIPKRPIGDVMDVKLMAIPTDMASY